MIKYIWSVLCLSSVVDSQSNNISLLNVFESLQIDLGAQKTTESKVINVPVQYELVTFWGKTTKGKEVGSLEVKIKDPNGKELKTIENKLIIPSDKRRTRYINKIQGIGLTSAGDYTFLVSFKQGKQKYKIVAEIPLEVKISKSN